jgi:Ser/Thr protein kinase RdoA (MazF antagonist)
MPRPVPTSDGACFASVNGGRYRCHNCVDGVPLPRHGNSAETAAAVGEVLAKLHQLALPWSRTLLPRLPAASGTHWIALANAARQATCVWAQRLADCLPVIRQLEFVVTRSWRAYGFIGSHRDLHPTNLLRLHTGAAGQPQSRRSGRDTRRVDVGTRRRVDGNAHNVASALRQPCAVCRAVRADRLDQP